MPDGQETPVFKSCPWPYPFPKYHCERNGTILGRAEVTKTESIVLGVIFMFFLHKKT